MDQKPNSNPNSRPVTPTPKSIASIVKGVKGGGSSNTPGGSGGPQYKVPTVIDWRVNLHSASLSTKWEYLLENQLFTDVIFHVGDDREPVRCHSLVLKMQSNHFETLLSSKPDKHEYELPNCSPSTFRKLLKYLYTDKLDISAEDAMDTLVLAKQFHLPALQGKCGRLVLDGLTVNNAAIILKKADELGDKHLSMKAQDYVIRHASQVLFSESFKNISLSCLQKLLQTNRNHWNIGELRILEAVKIWASAECSRQKMGDTGPNQYDVAKAALEQINFKALTAMQFTAHVVKPKLLPYEIMLSIQSELIEEETLKRDGKHATVSPPEGKVEIPMPLNDPFKKQSQENLKVAGAEFTKSEVGVGTAAKPILKQLNQVKFSLPNGGATNIDDVDYSVQYEDVYTLTRYTCLVTREWNPENNGHYKLCFSVSHPINFCGVSLYGQAFGGSKFTDVMFKLTTYDENTIVAEFVVRSAVPEDGGEFYVQFESGIKLAKTEWYTIILNINGRVYPYGTGGKKHYAVRVGKEPESEETVEFNFKNALGLSGASYVRGQLPKLHFYL